tara:strand:- start:2117 stop:2626 length:510 start_codon:yes stop_codon:yes gene_type:complete
MAHFAKIDDDNIVIDIQVINNNDILVDGVESEDRGIYLLEQLTGWSNWKKCSYNTFESKRMDPSTWTKTEEDGYRGNYPGVGSIWDETNQIFYHPSPFPSWLLNITTASWTSPVAKPTSIDTGVEGQYYNKGWVESNLRWEACLSDAIDTSINTHYWDANNDNWVAIGS